MIGTYSLATLAPVAVASMVAVIGVVHGLSDDPFELELLIPPRIDAVDYVPILALGMAVRADRHRHHARRDADRVAVPPQRRAGLAAPVDRRAWRSARWRWSRRWCCRPATARCVPGITTPYPLFHIGLLIIAEGDVASAVSIGSGFRGGLFFASLFLGAMVGKFFAGVGLRRGEHVTHALSPVVCALVAMSSMAVAIVGGPLTMGFLALESTGSLPLTIAVLAACVISSLTVRRTFGYSFATWRFHLRGEAIRSAVDIGWMRNLTVGRNDAAGGAHGARQPRR